MTRLFKNRIEAIFDRRKALICYAPLGDPLFPDSLIDIYVECGVDLIEIGLPNLNPYADGEVIRASMSRVRDAGLTTADIHKHTIAINEKHPDLATLWMCYEDADLANFESQILENNIDGLLMVGFDSRPDKKFLRNTSLRNSVDIIQFAGYTDKGFDAECAKDFQGFVFLQVNGGVTGARTDSLDESIPFKIQKLKDMGVDIPIAAGFGISTPEQVRQAIAMGADGIVTGSATVTAALEGEGFLRNYLHSMREALDS